MLRLRHGNPGDDGVSLDQPVAVRVREAQQHAAPGADPKFHLECGCWDVFSSCLFAVLGAAVVRIAADTGDAVVVAGHLTERAKVDGLGENARFTACTDIFSDGEGCLYVMDNWHIRMLQLPAAWQSSQQEERQQQHQQQHQQQQQQQQEELRGRQGNATGEASAQGQTGDKVEVTTIHHGREHGVFTHGAYDPLSRSLVLSGDMAVYRLYKAGGLARAGSATPAGTGVAAAAGAVVTEGAAERGEAEQGSGAVCAVRKAVLLADLDPDAGFPCTPDGIAVDGSGCVWAADVQDHLGHGEGLWTWLRRLDASGSETIPAKDLGALQDQRYVRPAILRNGCVGLVSQHGMEHKLLLIHLNVQPAAMGPAMPGMGGIGSSMGSQCSHALAAHLGALLDRQPDSTTDVEVEAGGRVFAAHRSVLAARSPYLAQRLDPGSGFADSGGPRISIPDTSHEAFAVLLRYLHTDSVGHVPPELLRPVGELADRLLLPGLCEQVGRQLLLHVCPGNVVELLLWADRHGGSFGQLLAGLKGWFQNQHMEGHAGWLLADEHVVRMMREGPALALELLYHEREDVRSFKRKRQDAASVWAASCCGQGSSIQGIIGVQVKRDVCAIAVGAGSFAGTLLCISDQINGGTCGGVAKPAQGVRHSVACMYCLVH